MDLISQKLKDWVKDQEARIWQEQKHVQGSASHLLAYTTKLSEESGELAEQILGKLGYQRNSKAHKFGEEELADEWADVMMVCLFLARAANIDTEKALARKMRTLEERNGR